MRRKDREITDFHQMEKIIADAGYLHLGMFDDGYPYVVPLHYGYLAEEGKLTFYVHSAKEGHKLDCIKKNNHVFIEIERGEKMIAAETACAYGAEYECVMCRGRASFVLDAKEKCHALQLLMKTQTGEAHIITEKMADQVTIIRIDVTSYSGKACKRS